MAIRSVNLSDTIGTWVSEFNSLGTDVGDLALLTTSDTSSIVAAIESLDSDLRAYTDVEVGGAVGVDSAATIAIITDPTNLSSIFNTGDFEIASGVVTLKDSAAALSITDDTTTNSALNVTMTDQTTGFETQLTVTSSKFTFNPSTGILDVSKITADSATITTLTSNSISQAITSDSATITTISTTTINATTVDATNLTADSATVTTLTAPTATINNLTANNIDADSATIGNIAFTSMNGGDINADSAYFTSIVNAQDFNSTSDISLKENIETINDAINIVNKIRPVNFTWKENGKGAHGVIAQEIEEVLPNIVDEDKNGVKRVAYSQIIPFLVQVVQEQHKEIQRIKAVVDLD